MPKFSVKKPYTVFVGVILIIILGIISFTSMTTDLLPSMDLPYVAIITTYPGASPEKIETSVTKPIEQTMLSVANIEKVSSSSSENASMVMLQFSESSNMDTVMIDVSQKLDTVKSSFEDGVGAPIVMKINPDMMPVMISAVSVEGEEVTEVTKFVEENILPELERLEGVASVSTTGLIEDQIKVTLKQDKIDEINNKVLENIDASLAKTGSELKSAKAQLVQGKKTLETNQKEQTQKIIEGLAAIDTGKAEILKAEIELKNKEEELTKTKTILQTALDEMNKKEETLEKRKQELQQIETPTEQEIAELQAIVTGLDTVNKTKTELNTKMQELQIGSTALEEGKSQIQEQKNTLNEKDKELQLAKSTLETELTKAAAKLDSSESELEKGLKEFEEAREKAYESANLEGVITANMISSMLTADNFSMPAGYIETQEGNLLVKVGEKFSSIDEIKNLTLFSFDIEGLENVTLQDLADVEFADNSQETYAKVNRDNGVLLSFSKQSTASTKKVTENIQNKIQELEEKYDNVTFTNLMDQGIYIDMIVGSVLNNLVYGGILAVIILLLFLKEFRPTIIIALSIPISLTFAITLMYFSGVSINIISLSGLALGVGMLVDNSIVVIENIYRLRKEGKDVKTAAIEGAKSVAGAIAASTLTTVCVFLPIVFIEGISRQLFTDMGLTIAYSLLASLIVALTLVPAMASKILTKTTQKENKFFNKISRLYEKSLNKALNHKVLVVIGCVVMLVLSGFLATRMGTSFMPSVDGTQISISIELPKELSKEEVYDISNQMIDKLLTISEIEKIGALESSATSMISTSSSGNNMSMYVLLKEKKKRKNEEIAEDIKERLSQFNAEVEISTSNMDMSALAGSGIQVIVKGENLDKLKEIGKDIETILQQLEGLEKIEGVTSESNVEQRIQVDKNKAMEYGLTVAQVYSEISKEIVNEVDSTKVEIENKEYPIIVLKPEEQKVNLDNIMDTELSGKKNNKEVSIKLSEIATIKEATGLESISRENNERLITVSATVDSNHNVGLVGREFKNKLDEYQAPEGYRIELSGEDETINQSLMDLAKMILLAIVFIYLIMVAQFQSLKLPFIIMFTIPLAFTGGLLGLFITGTEISIIAMLGFLVLAGIVVNNGIVLIDYINQLRDKGIERMEAIKQAGKTRLRPIMMTALTTILGLSTMALGIGNGAEMTQPLGIVAIGGLIYSTILTLYLIPCMYDIMCKKKK